MHKLALALASLVIIAGVAPTTAVADDGSFRDDLADDEDNGLPGGPACLWPGDDVTIGDCVGAANDNVVGIVERATYRVSTIRQSDDEAASKAEEYADTVAKTFEENNESIESYVNSRFDGDAADYDTIQVTFDVEGNTETRYLLADANESDFTNTRVVEETNRSVDYEVELRDFAAAKADEELERFLTEFVEADEDISRGEFVRMANRYSGHIDLPEGVTP